MSDPARRTLLLAPFCLMKATELSSESIESPFFEHFHQLAIPLAALLDPPEKGVVVRTTPIDLGSYDTDAFKRLVTSSGLDEKSLLVHTHDVSISREQLVRIADGEKNVELRVVSPKGNFVHNFLITATPSTLVKIRKHRALK